QHAQSPRAVDAGAWPAAAERHGCGGAVWSAAVVPDHAAGGHAAAGISHALSGPQAAISRVDTRTDAGSARAFAVAATTLATTVGAVRRDDRTARPGLPERRGSVSRARSGARARGQHHMGGTGP